MAWAVVIEELIAAGHPNPWDYSIGQAVAFAELAAERRCRERLATYSDMRAAYHADEAGDKKVRDLLNGA